MINRLRLSALVAPVALAAGAAALLSAVLADSSDTPDTVPSRDAVALRRYFAPDIALKNVQWELFATPEAPIGLEVAGPTDFLTLIVVGRAVDPTAAQRLVPTLASVPAFAVPNAQRSWLPQWSQRLIKRVVDEAALPVDARCQRHAVPGVASGTRHDGFVCTENGVVMYLVTLATPSD
ncbi:hypothetical protein [Niveibacterium sp.]|uniref:hypothetical protein n=1 Tax=Niveibacterium sp. TaxID=2017444 RepID=UPI0035B291E5